MNIPIIDLKAQYQQIQVEVEAAVLRVLRSGHYILGPEGHALEEELANFTGAKFAVLVNSGTTALHLALVAAGIGPGDEVITTPFSFIATAEAISYVGATPVFADIDPETYCIDPREIRKKITKKTQAILPVHLYGQSSDMYEIEKISDEYDLDVIEDCAQSMGTTFHDKHVGTIGGFGCFSFFPTKNLGAAGEGGLITVRDEAIAEKLRALRIHGSKHRYQHEMIGYNARLNEIQCAILRIKLKYLPEWTRKRQEHAALFNKLLAPLPVVTPKVGSKSNHVYHQYGIAFADEATRDKALSHLADNGIHCAVHYPKPIPMQECYRDLGYHEGEFPVAESLSRQVMSLPVYPELTDEQIHFIVNMLKEVF